MPPSSVTNVDYEPRTATLVCWKSEESTPRTKLSSTWESELPSSQREMLLINTETNSEWTGEKSAGPTVPTELSNAVSEEIFHLNPSAEKPVSCCTHPVYRRIVEEHYYWHTYIVMLYDATCVVNERHHGIITLYTQQTTNEDRTTTLHFRPTIQIYKTQFITKNKKTYTPKWRETVHKHQFFFV